MQLHRCFYAYLFMRIRDLSRRKIESVFGHFTTFSIKKTDTSQNSLPENGLSTKFNVQACVDETLVHHSDHHTKATARVWT